MTTIRSLFAAGILCLLLTNCKSAKKEDKKEGKSEISQVASEICNCLSPIEKNLSAEAKDIFLKAASADDPQKEMTAAIMSLASEKQATIAQEFQSFGDMDNPGSSTGKCMDDLKAKYEKKYDIENDEALQQSLLKELTGVEGCSFVAALMKMGSKMKDK
jgi:hypothetical protein